MSSSLLAPGRETVVQIPYRPRPQQKLVRKAMQTGRFGVLVCHRRMGKTILGVNLLQQGALGCSRERPRYAYIGPTYRQAKATAWDYMQYYARPIPGIKINQSELRIDYPNASQVRIYGADNPDSLRGIYLDGVVLDEFGMHPPTTFSEVIGPTLVDRGGWALFAGTPAGKNQFFDMVQRARAEQAASNPEWYFGEFKASETGLLDAAYLAAQRAAMTEDEYAQEFECSFEASVKGAIYGAQVAQARADGRVCRVPYDPALPVDTAWDLGVGDATAIWFVQRLRSGEVRLIDYHETSGEGLPTIVQTLQRRGYPYGRHWAPPDIQVRELGTGKSRLEVAATLGVKFEVTRQIGLEDGIAAARLLFPRCWFDEAKTAAGIIALTHYRRDYNTRIGEFKAIPVHDFASHGADAFRYLAVAYQVPVEKKPATRPAFTGPRAPGTGWMS